jgi:outer membrane lipoprotein-sorting protein
MARIQPAPYPDDDEPGSGPGRGRRAARYAVPVAVAGVAAATISLVPALADAGDPSLPSITAEQLLTKIAASDTQTVDGTVKVTTDLGLPSALSGGAAGGLFSGAAASGGPDGGGSGSPAAPQARLTQLLAGTHTLHVAADGPDRQKISLIEPAAEYSVFHDGTQLWAYDSASDQAYHQTLPAPAQRQQPDGGLPEDFPATPQAAARQILAAADGTSAITVDGTARVAGHSAYELLVTPQHADRTTVGSVRIAVDAKTGVPLKVSLTPRSGGKAVFDVGFTRVGFAKPAASTFTFTPPKGVKVTEGGTAGQDTHRRPDAPRDGAGVQPTLLGKGWDSIAVIESPGGLPDKTGKAGGTGGDAWNGGRGGAGEGGSPLEAFGQRVNGSFGSGTLFHTRLVNALLTDKGTLYVGAVTQSALTDAANTAAK